MNSYSPSPSCDILVSRGLGSPPTTMSSASAVGAKMGIVDDGVTLGDVVRRLQAIEDTVWPMQPVPDLVAALENMVCDQGQQHIALNLALQRIKRQVQDPCCASCHRNRAEDDEDLGSVFLPTTHKLEFPKFEGMGDPLPWLNHCEW
jgi:hypothetical protein